MGAGNYKHCDKCGGKAFYDADLEYDDKATMREAGVNGYGKLGYVGDWAVLCDECAKLYKTAIVPIEDDI